tara:strand:+ start:637 stop:915 length:279 start_codon:yes stop_codon:yes gene_type:complete
MIQILEIDSFVRYKGVIGILQTESKYLPYIFIAADGSKCHIEEEYLEHPSALEIENAVENSPSLKQLALNGELIFERTAEMVGYLNYCKSYN